MFLVLNFSWISLQFLAEFYNVNKSFNVRHDINLVRTQIFIEIIHNLIFFLLVTHRYQNSLTVFKDWRTARRNTNKK